MVADVVHNAAIGLAFASAVVAGTGWVTGRWQYEKGRTISRYAVLLACTGMTGIFLAVGLLAVGA